MAHGVQQESLYAIVSARQYSACMKAPSENIYDESTHGT